MVDVKNRFEQLQVDTLDKSADSTYNNVIKAHNKAAELLVPERARSEKKLPWENEDICKKQKALYNAFEMKKNNHNAENIMKVEDAKAELTLWNRKYMLKRKSASLKQHKTYLGNSE